MYRRNALSSYTKQFSEFISLRRRPFSRSIGEYHESHGIARYEENSIEFDEFDSMKFRREDLSSPFPRGPDLRFALKSRTFSLSFRFSLTTLSFTSRFSSRSSLR